MASKWTREFKLAVAKEYQAGAMSTYLANCYGIARNLVKYWIKAYAFYGDALKVTTTQYSEEFKAMALNLLWTNGWSIKHRLRRCKGMWIESFSDGIQPTQMHGWRG